MLTRLRKLSRSRRVLLGVGVLGFIVAGLSGGCYAHQRPPQLTGEERSLLETAPLPYSVTVAWWDEQTRTGQNPDAYSGSLAQLVARCGVFRTSRYERSSNPSGQDLVATPTGEYCNSAVIPILSIISLGIIPTVFQDEQCAGMLLRKSAGRPKTESVQVDIRYKGPVIMGWAAVFVGALPGWSYGEVADDSRFAERFRIAAIRRRADIDRLLGR